MRLSALRLPSSGSPFHDRLHQNALGFLIGKRSALPDRLAEMLTRLKLTAVRDQLDGRFFHGYYDCYCYLPLYVSVAANAIRIFQAEMRDLLRPSGWLEGLGSWAQTTPWRFPGLGFLLAMLSATGRAAPH